MLSVLLSLFLAPVTSQATSVKAPIHYAEIVNIQMNSKSKIPMGVVTFMQGCGDFSPKVELSKAIQSGSMNIIKLRVELSSYPGQVACLALPTKQMISFQVTETIHGPVSVIADSNFTLTGTDLIARDLNKFFFQAGSQLASEQIDAANVEISFTNKEIILSLYRDSHCPPGMMCTLSVPAPIVYQLPLLSVQTGGCGEVIYTAAVDHMPVDGLFTQIKVIDNTKNYCESYLAFATTEVHLTFKGPRPAFEEHHRIEGLKALQPL